MSDTLKTDQGQSNVEDADALISRPLFEDDEEESALVAPPARRHRTWWIVLSIVLIVVLVGGGVLFYTRRMQASAVKYSTVPVSVGNLTTTVSASGPLQAKAAYAMNFTTTGQVSEIDVHVGQQVTTGQVLAKLNAPALGIAVQQAQLTVNNDQETYNTAVSNGAAQTTIDSANNALQIAKLQLQTAQNNLAAATMTAPGAAFVAAVNGTVGQNVSSGGSSSASSSSSSTSSPFIELVNTSGYTISASVNEADIANVQVNQPVRFTITAYPSQTFRATVSSVGMVGTTTSGVVSYPITMLVDMNSLGGAHLYPGMTATANITTAQRIGVQLVSNSAFTFMTTALRAGVINRSALGQFAGGAGSANGAGQQNATGSTQSTGTRRIVLVLHNGQLEPVAVTVGLTNGTLSEVLSGLNEGDQVVVGATGGAFANLSTGTNTTGGAGGGLFRNGGGGGFGGGGARSGSGG